ncbi:MocR-like pyridoxine biosynthesis transcription factor PdxR [Agaribacter flavus]|uniref:PLP-dependent aminotransferase family protein n=1 Tax=Agaribacter flavus TaxID=1902781 RepID=A0ABV7FS80_9ALTE
MLEQLINIDKNASESLKDQIKRAISIAILDERISIHKPLPSSRKLSQALKVSRQTVMFAFEDLVGDGYLIAKSRRGYFANPEILKGTAKVDQTEAPVSQSKPDWQGRFAFTPSHQRNITKPSDWQKYPYPFISGQIDPASFPIAEWRECSKQALNVIAVKDWTSDQLEADDPMLIEQIRSRVLPRRGIWAKAEEILVTVGTQQSLYLLSTLLAGKGKTIAMENPGYPDARNIFCNHFDKVIEQAIDQDGLLINDNLNQADYAYITPSHQWPTSVTMPISRRKHLLKKAVEQDLIILEDDYEIESNYIDEPLPALKSLDIDDRVIYMSSFSKVLAPGLRMGFMVAPKALIDEARVLRRLMMRHPPLNNQRMTALFIARGHYDALIKRLWRVYKNNWHSMNDAIDKYIPTNIKLPVNGGTTSWIKGPDGLNCQILQKKAREQGILIELGDIAFADDSQAKQYFRLGFTVIPNHKIEAGIQKLAALIRELS